MEGRKNVVLAVVNRVIGTTVICACFCLCVCVTREDDMWH